VGQRDHQSAERLLLDRRLWPLCKQHAALAIDHFRTGSGVLRWLPECLGCAYGNISILRCVPAQATMGRAQRLKRLFAAVPRSPRIGISNDPPGPSLPTTLLGPPATAKVQMSRGMRYAAGCAAAAASRRVCSRWRRTSTVLSAQFVTRSVVCARGGE
jgi:hypothetical protein